MIKKIVECCVGVLLVAGLSALADVAWDDTFDSTAAWNDGFDAELNANWTVFENGAGASVSQTNGQMVMDTGIVAGSAHAAVNTLSDQAGSNTTFNGAGLYDFYSHQVSVRFDIASMTGTTDKGRNVFYLSIGEDADGNFAPQGKVLDNGVGLSIEHLAGDVWRINNLSLTNAVAAGGAAVGTISGVPTAITYTLNGTQLEIAMEGATFTGTGLATASATVEDVSAYITDYHLAYGAYNRGAVLEETVVVLDAVAVDLGGDVNSNWTVYENGTGAAVSQTNGQMVMDTAIVAGSAQAAVNTQTDQAGSTTTFNGAALYDFYDHQVKASFDIASMAGVPSPGRNMFYFSIGDDSAGNYVPQNTVLDDGIGFALEQVDTGGGPYWRIGYQALDGASASGGVVANISGLPTSLTYTLDGTNATIRMEGATIAALGNQGSGSIGGSELTVALADLSANISGYTMAFGAYNFGATVERTVMTLDALTVSVGAEASSFQTWADSWGVPIGSETNDYDGDLLDNLAEYGLGGDPTNHLNVGQVPTLGNDGGTMVYVHAQRTDDSNLSYYLETTADLVSPGWTNSGYSVVATNVTGGLFDYVTNTIPTAADQSFLRLRIENN